MRAWSLTWFALVLFVVGPAAAQSPGAAAGPETFSAKAQAQGPGGASITAPVVVHLDRYTPDFDRGAVEDALRINGYLGFVPALRKAPEVGYVEAGGKRFKIRWARQTPSGAGRTIVVVTDTPVAFLGAGQTDAKSRKGYEVAIVQLKVDARGGGTGTMAAAARVKPGGETGVQVDDYAEAPVELTAVTRTNK